MLYSSKERWSRTCLFPADKQEPQIIAGILCFAVNQGYSYQAHDLKLAEVPFLPFHTASASLKAQPNHSKGSSVDHFSRQPHSNWLPERNKHKSENYLKTTLKTKTLLRFFNHILKLRAFSTFFTPWQTKSFACKDCIQVMSFGCRFGLPKLSKITRAHILLNMHYNVTTYYLHLVPCQLNYIFINC